VATPTAIQLETWGPDPERPGYLKFERTPSYRDVFRQLAAALETEGLIDEYFAPAIELETGNAEHPHTCGGRLDEHLPRHIRWVACWAVTGGSEGDYIHVEFVVIAPGGHTQRQLSVLIDLGSSLTNLAVSRGSSTFGKAAFLSSLHFRWHFSGLPEE